MKDHFPHQPKPTAAPPPQAQPAAIARMVGMARAAMSGRIVVIVLSVIAAEHLLPSPLKPSDIIGGFHGSIDAATARRQQDALAQQAYKLAEAQSRAPAAAEKLAQSFEAQTTMANTADMACAAGSLIPRGDRDWGVLGDFLRSGCGVGNTIRQGMVNTMRQGSTLQPGPDGAER